ncbi:MAG: type I restriction enzyme HsdR N-terminal domain-containing protein [Bacteroidia bacterium]|nr:type I restriction enzyme HsdR N-terminal domain-containing protein [Bacteroidia bacterium]
MIRQAQRDRYLFLNKKQDKVSYLPQGKTRKLSNPEESVQIQAYLSLIYKFGYPAEQIRVCEHIKIGSSSREADIVVYEDAACKTPLIIVECKKPKISASGFYEAIDQGFSYAAATHAKYVWTIAGKKSAAFKVMPGKIKERHKNRIRRIPTYKQTRKSKTVVRRKWEGLKNHAILGDTLLFSSVLIISTLLLSKAATEYHDWIYERTTFLWEDYGMNELWIYNLIISLASLFSLFFGALFMRSHRMFGVQKGKKRTMLFIIGMILLIPAWYVGTSEPDALWWSLDSFNSREYPIWTYLWPYIKSIPFQFFAVYALIWLASKAEGR